MPDAIPHRMLSTRGEFRDAVRDAFARAAEQGCREVFISDVNFADWPLGEASVIESLSRWAFAHRKLTVLAQHFDDLPRRHPRWVTWRRQWAHVVTCKSLHDAEPGKLPSMFLAPGLVTVRLFDADTHRAMVSGDVADAVKAKELLDALLQHSVDAFPATTLGL